MSAARNEIGAIQTRDERFQMMFSAGELAAIDDYRFAERIRTRAEAVRRLCELALSAMAEDGAVDKLAEAERELARLTDPAYLTAALDRVGVVDAEWKARALVAENAIEKITRVVAEWGIALTDLMSVSAGARVPEAKTQTTEEPTGSHRSSAEIAPASQSDQSRGLD